MKNKFKSSVLLQILVLSFFAGSMSTLNKYALEEVPTASFVAIRLLIVATLTLLVMKYYKQKASIKNFKKFVPVAIFWCLNFLLFAIGVQSTTSITAQFIHISIPMLTALMAMLLLRERLSWTQWSGVYIAALGVSGVIFANNSLSFSGHEFIGNIIVFSSALCFSIYAVLSKMKKFHDIKPAEMILIASILGSIIYLPFAVNEIGTGWIGNVSILSWLAVILVGIISTVFYIGMQSIIKSHGPSVATTNLYLIPIFTIFWASLILGEKLELIVMLGGLVSLAGVWMITRFSSRDSQVK